ncbi:TetR/AcrR family transcriptional regulator [Plantibacter sp. CFBP 8804]|uniref:TetR/AcrR family transcriptional regulator n=1 Tax=Plantibacter sp. CFBP 8804 TaxID=2775270 RepID=UPI001780EED3|nr:TetR/AcrR family transcriptional regulator [Plantibacter sp. CFBP 8804]MBD8518879.1 TetR/AcrR family transcriptional regulator [Plantibacter sp. CFBP 8804]
MTTGRDLAVQSGSSARERILDAATRLFSERGVRAVGVARVISEAGVAKATLYAHFPSKDDLVRAYLARQADRTEQEIKALEREGVGGVQLIRAVFNLAARAAAQDRYAGCCFITATAEHLEDAAGVAQVLADQRASLRARFVRCIDDDDPHRRDRTARQLVALLDGAKVASLEDGSAAFDAVVPLIGALAAPSRAGAAGGRAQS